MGRLSSSKQLACLVLGRDMCLDGRGRKNKSRSHLIVPTLRVVTQGLTLCVSVDAERPDRHSHAQRGNDPGYRLLPSGKTK